MFDFTPLSVNPDDGFFAVTRQQADIIMQALSPIYWRTRWENTAGMTRDEIESKISELELALMTPIDCEFIVDCVLNSNTLQQAILDLVNNGGQPGPKPTKPTITIEPVTPPGPCDYDALFAVINQIVDFLNDIVTDLFQQVIAASSPAGRIGDLIEAIPIIGEAPADDLLQFVESIVSDFAENYDAQYTVGLRLDMVCELFCIAKANGCVLTIGDLQNYYLDKLVQQFDASDFLVLIGGFASSPLLNDVDIVYATHLFVMTAFAVGAYVAGLDSSDLVKIITSFYNDSNPDWSTLCDCLGDPWQQNWLSGVGINPASEYWQIGVGTYDSPNDEIDDGLLGGPSDAVVMQFSDFPAGTLLSRFYVRFFMQNNSYSRVSGLYVRNPLGDIVYQQEKTLLGYYSSNTLEIAMPDLEVGPQWRIEISLIVSNQVTGNRVELKRIELEGRGTNPWA